MIVFVIQKNIKQFGYSSSSVPGFDILEHGFTGHEHIRQFDLINMNARLYDPQIARFLSPDNEITNPENPQNYDRYAYCLNNPLKYTDPSGNMPSIIPFGDPLTTSILFAFINAGYASQKGGPRAAAYSLAASAYSYGVSSVVNSYIPNPYMSFGVSSIITDVTLQLALSGKYSGISTITALSMGYLKMGFVDAFDLTLSFLNETTSNQQENGVEPHKYLSNKSWHDMTNAEKGTLIAPSLDHLIKLQESTNESDIEWSMPIAETKINEHEYVIECYDFVKGVKNKAPNALQAIQPKGSEIVGVAHSHPGGSESYDLSVGDVFIGGKQLIENTAIPVSKTSFTMI